MYNIIKKIHPPDVPTDANNILNTNSIDLNVFKNNADPNDNYTLPFFSNPNYLARINIHKKTTNEIHDATKCEFYKKRTCGLFKELYKNKDVPDNVKNAHSLFNKLAISYFESMDTSDIIQRMHSNVNVQYNGQIPPSSVDLSKNTVNVNIDNINPNINKLINEMDINTALFNSSNKISSLDSYVKTTKNKIPLSKPMFIPSKLNIDIMADEFKTKGIKTVKF